MQPAVNDPTTPRAVSTFVSMLLIPIATFAIAGLATLKAGVAQVGLSQAVVIYALGTVPGLILGTRYPGNNVGMKWLYALGYLLVCAGLYFVMSLMLGCWVTDVCL